MNVIVWSAITAKGVGGLYVVENTMKLDQSRTHY